jgi:hypothetical protein
VRENPVEEKSHWELHQLDTTHIPIKLCKNFIAQEFLLAHGSPLENKNSFGPQPAVENKNSFWTTARRWKKKFLFGLRLAVGK